MYDVKEIRKLFPMLNGVKMQNKPLVFLDNASTTFKPQCVIDEINLYYTKLTSNSHRGDYDLCFKVDKLIEETRSVISSFINCDKNEVVFTSGTTMSLNTIAYGYARKFLHQGDEIILDEAEHASNSLPWFKIAKEIGAVIKFIELDEKGRITLENLRKTLTNKTKIVSLAAIGNVQGYEIDLPSFAKEIHEHNAIFVVDGAQSVPHKKMDFKGSDIDYLCFSGHKMCGPTGIGCLIGKYELLDKMDSFIVGGGNNVTFNKECDVTYLNPPFKFESGTNNIEGILGLKAAVEFISSIGIDNIHAHDVELHKYLVSELEQLDNVEIYNKEAEGGILTFNVKGVFSQDEATLLNSKGIAVRSGLHCAKMLNDFLPKTGTCRVSTYLYTSKEEIDIFINALKEGGDILDAYFN